VHIKIFCEAYVPYIAFIIFLNIVCFFFFVQAPVILVSDNYFTEIYGARFEQIRRLETAFKIRKNVKIVRIQDNTDALSIIEAIEHTSGRPAAVFFPFAYSDAAENYARLNAEKNLSTKTFVFLDRNPVPKTDTPLYYVRNDTDIDFHRAGACAGLLARERLETLEAAPDKRETIYFICTVPLNPADQESFAEGIKESGFKGGLDFVNGYESRGWDNAAAVVAYGPAAAFFQAQVDVPAVLFSWYNNVSYMPANIKVLVDDSPYYMIPQALSSAQRAFVDAKVFAEPSNFIIIDSRIKNKVLVANLLKVITIF
jgi:hypothetical protein